MHYEESLYPLKFDSILKEKVWGGNKLALHYGKGDGEMLGESWELSGVKDNISIVSNGKLKGLSLVELIETYKGNLVGETVYTSFGKKFPLLFKFIDAKEDLSVQLHPSDELAKKRHNSFGKTEMWYVLDAEKDARLILGFNKKMTEELYLKHLSENSLTQILHSEKVKKGDAFFIVPGTVHAIGAGVLLAEIQQTSDITYRIYDWDRPDTNGEMRELHTELAKEAIDFEASKTRLYFSEEKNNPTKICRSPFFEVNKLNLTESIQRDLARIDSFVVYMCLEGSAFFETENISEGNQAIKKGETILIPACFSEVKITTDKAELLEVYVPQ